MRKLFILTLLPLLLIVSRLEAQTEKVREYLHLVATGRIDEVKKALPDLLAEYPNDAGVQLLHATVIDDAFRALEKYKSIVKNYPESEWADDATWRIVQFYAATGDIETANKELDNYRKKYPNSEFLLAATDVVRMAENLQRRDVNTVGAVDRSVEVKEIKPKVKPVAEKAKPEIAKKPVAAKVTKGTKITKDTKPTKETKPTKVVVSGKDTKTSDAKPDAAKKTLAENKAKAEPKDQMETVDLPKKAQTESVPASKYGLQVGVYSSKEAADLEVKKFKTQRMLAEIMKKDVDGESMFAVVIGDYSSKESAEAAKNIVLQQCKCSPIIFKK